MTDIKSVNRFILYELWHDCSNNCAFCHNKGAGDVDKLSAIDFIVERLNDVNELEVFNEFGIIGGEFFDYLLNDKKINVKFYNVLFKKICELLHSGKMKKFYITSALMFNDKKLLKLFCDKLIENNIDMNTLICTSYDVIGRFHTTEQESNWKDNMLWIKLNYPSIKTHVETILSGKFIKMVLNGEFDICDFQKKYNTVIDYISPHIIDYHHTETHLKSKIAYNKFIPEFFPYRADFILFMNKTIIEDKSIHAFKFLSNFIRADLIYTIINGKYEKIYGRRNGDGVFNGLDKKLGITFIDGYIDSDVRMETDANILRETLS